MISSAVVGFSDGHGVVGEVDIAVVACVWGLEVLIVRDGGEGLEEPTEECMAVSRVDQSLWGRDTYIWACCQGFVVALENSNAWRVVVGVEVRYRLLQIYSIGLYIRA